MELPCDLDLGCGPGGWLLRAFKRRFSHPLLASFFFVGGIRLYQSRAQALPRWILLSILCFLVPGFLTINMDSFRIVQVLPLLLATTALPGLQVFLEKFFLSWRKLGWAGVLLITLGIDVPRLFGPYLVLNSHPQEWKSLGKSLSRYRAYQILNEEVSQGGPGLILGEWDIPSDRTLQVTTYLFNAAENPALHPEQAQWLAVVTDSHYQPFLQKSFPQGQWWLLDTDLPEGGENRMLGIIPVQPQNREQLLRWAKADLAFRDLNWGIDHIHDPLCLERVEEGIGRDEGLLENEPFLESSFWKKRLIFIIIMAAITPII